MALVIMMSIAAFVWCVAWATWAAQNLLPWPP